MTFDELMQKRLAADATEAADLLRLALAEADEDPRGLLLSLQAVLAARGNLEDIGLSFSETSALLQGLGRHIKPEWPLHVNGVVVANYR